MEQSHCLHDEDSAARRGTPQTKIGHAQIESSATLLLDLQSIFSAKSHSPPLFYNQRLL
jgi:hypothetical protein